MDSVRYRLIRELFAQALEIESGHRAAFLDRECKDDSELRMELENLLMAADGSVSGGFDAGILKTAVWNTIRQTSMTLTFHIGKVLGTYEVTGHLGTGGMGEVYRARDSRLKREVAIKVLPNEFARDTDRLARFQREAEVLASLNNNHIGAIYELGVLEDIRFLVLELVEGETLADRISRGPVPLDEALRIAKQIIRALESAHEKRIVHRDLKPANIKLTADGSVKVLDFGLARVHESSDVHPSNTPTLHSEPGVIAGTPLYMSPEQAKGQAAHPASDIWAFGCVLYEMLTGSPPFHGETLADILASILKSEPDWKRLPGHTPESIHRLLRRCLQRDRDRRLRHIGDAMLEIEEAENRPDQRSKGLPDRMSRREWFAWTSVSALAITNLGLAGWQWMQTNAEKQRPQSRPTLPTTDPVSLALSPDGEKTAFVVTTDKGSQLCIRKDGKDTLLEGTDGASFPFWDPGSGRIGFAADGNLKWIDIDTGEIQWVLERKISVFRGGTWNSNNVILYGTASSAIKRTVADGSEREPRSVRPLAKGQGSQRFPQFLPGGNEYIYYASGTDEAEGVWLGHLGEKEPLRLLTGKDVDAAAVFAPSKGQSSGHLLYVKSAALFAQPLDLDKLAQRYTPKRVAVKDGVAVDRLSYAAALSASAKEVLVYRTGWPCAQRQLEWLDRDQKPIGTVGPADDHCVLNPSLSPVDDKQIAFSEMRERNKGSDIHIITALDGPPIPMTGDSGTNMYPVWSPDGERIVYASTQMKGLFDLYLLDPKRQHSEALYSGGELSITPMDWSSSGHILYRQLEIDGNWTLWALPITAKFQPGKIPIPVIPGMAGEQRDGQFSPDGEWIAYQSNVDGKSNIYITGFPNAGYRVPISIKDDGGAQVRWNRSDPGELFYIDLRGYLISVRIHISGDRKTVTVPENTRRKLFQTRIGGALQATYRQQYAVSNDGKRFLMSNVTNKSPDQFVYNPTWK